MTKFGFNDLHSFKDYIGFVRICAPDQFPVREGVPIEDQWTLDLAFRGLREGLSLAVKEKGTRTEFDECSKLVEEAYAHYNAGQRKEGFFALDNAQKILKRIRTQ
jgi:hypothetical protein